jgi:release factor glutamine methyltransferase
VAHAAGLDRAAMIAEMRSGLDETVFRQIDALVERRASGEPVGRILGRREFWGLDFALGPDTLEPRPDSEALVEAALDFVDRAYGRQAPLRIADLGTGTGCLLIALLSELPAAWGTGVDISAGAVAVARGNAEAIHVSDRAHFVVGSWTAPLVLSGGETRFDVIVTNPPYIESDACAKLDREVAEHDPVAALDGGPDGLDAYRAILSDIPRVMAPYGALFLELGRGQAAAVCDLARSRGLMPGAVHRDLAGIERVLTVRREPQ